MPLSRIRLWGFFCPQIPPCKKFLWCSETLKRLTNNKLNLEFTLFLYILNKSSFLFQFSMEPGCLRNLEDS